MKMCRYSTAGICKHVLSDCHKHECPHTEYIPEENQYVADNDIVDCDYYSLKAAKLDVYDRYR